MRKTVVAAVLIMSTIVCKAQVRTAIFGGPHISTAKYSINGQKQSTSGKCGFQLGTTLKVPFENKLYFAPAFFYSLKGYEVVFTQKASPPDSMAIDNNTTIHTFELGALAQYDFAAQPGHFFVKAGPSIDLQLSGKEKFNKKNATTVERDMTFSFTKYGRVAANLVMQFGYETKNGFQFFVQYNYGIGNMNNADFGPSIYHRVYGISIGKYLGKK